MAFRLLSRGVRYAQGSAVLEVGRRDVKDVKATVVVTDVSPTLAPTPQISYRLITEQTQELWKSSIYH
jgi:hypothetical protein